MKVEVAMDVYAPSREPYVQVRDEHVLGITLRPGFIKVGRQRSSMRRAIFTAGQMSFVPRLMERWVGAGHQERLLLGISDSALTAAREGTSGSVEVRPSCNIVDVRLAALVKAVNAERVKGFPSGRLFLDSVEQAIAAALVDAFAGQNRSVQPLRSGLGPVRLRTITELVHAKMEDELTLRGNHESALSHKNRHGFINVGGCLRCRSTLLAHRDCPKSPKVGIPDCRLPRWLLRPSRRDQQTGRRRVGGSHAKCQQSSTAEACQVGGQNLKNKLPSRYNGQAPD